MYVWRELPLPEEWWEAKKTYGAEVYYSVFVMENSRCTFPVFPLHHESFTAEALEDDVEPLTTTVPPAREPVKTLVSRVTLSHGQVTYQELKEDHHILVYIPQKSFYPGSKFRVPIKLQAESDLQIFVIK